jgi:hypothetical protein
LERWLFRLTRRCFVENLHLNDTTEAEADRGNAGHHEIDAEKHAENMARARPPACPRISLVEICRRRRTRRGWNNEQLMKRDLYADVSARILAELETGAAPWTCMTFHSTSPNLEFTICSLT